MTPEFLGEIENVIVKPDIMDDTVDSTTSTSTITAVDEQNDNSSNFKFEPIKIKVNDIQTELLLLCHNCNLVKEGDQWTSTNCNNCQSSMVYYCAHCQKTFAYPRRLKSHLKTHRYLFMCRICDFTTKYSYSMKNHIFVKHTWIDPKNYHSCLKCSKKYKTLYTKNHHQKQCRVEPLFKCDFCEYKVNEQSFLTAHVDNNHRTEVKTPFGTWVVYSKPQPLKIIFRKLPHLT